jgi:hypothetical protein
VHSSIPGAARWAGAGDAAHPFPVPETEGELLWAGSVGSNKVRLYFLTRSSYNTGSESGKYEGDEAEDGTECESVEKGKTVSSNTTSREI